MCDIGYRRDTPGICAPLRSDCECQRPRQFLHQGPSTECPFSPILPALTQTLSHHELETALGDNVFRAVCARSSPSWSVCPDPVNGGMSDRLELGAFYSSLFVSKRGTAHTFRGRSPVVRTSLQNENSLGQDPCAISSILDAACRGLCECTHSSDRATGTRDFF